MRLILAVVLFIAGILAVRELAHWMADTGYWLFGLYFAVLLALAAWMEKRGLGPIRRPGSKPWNN